MKTSLKIKLLSTMLLMVFAGVLWAQQAPIQYFRPYDQRGINVFEPTKDDTIEYTGFKFRVGAGFTQGFQNFSHSNKKARAILADGGSTYIEVDPGSNTFVNRVSGAAITGDFVKNPKVYGGYLYTPDPIGAPNTKRALTNANQLYEMAAGFPLAQANLNFDVQLADGVRVTLISYMSAHHHNEFWVKGGFFQIDKVGFLNSEFMDRLWKNLTLKVGHMQINYGDAQFRRSDGGHTLWNPFIENNIMDAFTTEIGGELYWQKNGFLVMAGMTDGEIQGNVTKPNDRSPNIYGKLAYDKQISDDLRVRLSVSGLTTKSSVRNTLYAGDRTGSNYQFVMDNTAATTTTAYTSGRFNPGLTDNLMTIVFNPFVKFRGFEFFGTFEQAKGKSQVENDELFLTTTGQKLSDDPAWEDLDDRKATQSAVDVLYRFGKNEKFYVGGKYNLVKAEVALGQATGGTYLYAGDRYDVEINRMAFATGWFITPAVLFKAEYVVQEFKGFPGLYTNRSTPTPYQDSHILSGGKFNGFVIQGIISF